MILQVKSAQSAWPLGRKEGGKTALWVSSEDTGGIQGRVEPWSLTEIWPQAWSCRAVTLSVVFL